MYRGKFSDIYHLVPFYRGSNEKVIAVYDHSHCFQGYVAQGFRSFFRREYAHYFFVADDMVLNPVITERNYETQLHLDAESSFLSDPFPLHTQHRWPHIRDAFEYDLFQPGVLAQQELPDLAAALQHFRRCGLDIQPVAFNQVYPRPSRLIRSKKDFFRFMKWINKRFKHGNKLNLPYPLVGAYSDIFVVAAQAIETFSRYCGVFSATRLFVELAIPTALVFAANKIVGQSSLDLKAGDFWNGKEREILAPYSNCLASLVEEFPRDLLYLHPVKLSKWSIEKA